MTFAVTMNDEARGDEQRAIEILRRHGYEVDSLTARDHGEGDLGAPVDGTLRAPDGGGPSPFEMKCRRSIAGHPLTEDSMSRGWRGEWLVTEYRRFDMQAECVRLSEGTGRSTLGYFILFLPLSDVVYIGNVCRSIWLVSRWSSEWLVNPTELKYVPTWGNSITKQETLRWNAMLRVIDTPHFTRLAGPDAVPDADPFAREAA